MNAPQAQPPQAAGTMSAPTPAAPASSAPASASASASAPLDMNRLVVFVADKAGMSSGAAVSKEHINRVIYESSVGSAHFKAQLVKSERVSQRIERMKRTLLSAHRSRDSPLVQAALLRTQRRLGELESSRSLARNWLHIDMDAFFVAAELLDRPELADKPVCVGSMQMISTSNYVARRFGVRSAMPGFIAVKLCPDLIFLPHDGAKYVRIARATREIFAEYDAHFEAGSLDEAYLDVSDFVRREARRRARAERDPAFLALYRSELRRRAEDLRPPRLGQSEGEGGGEAAPLDYASLSALEYAPLPPLDSEDALPLPKDEDLSAAQIELHASIAEEVASEIRSRVLRRTRLTCSVGVACNRMLAKIATDMNKPNGQFCIPSTASAVQSFMDPLPVRKVPGVGKVMERVLNEVGVDRCGQMRELDKAMLLFELFSPDTASWLLSASLGLASNTHSDHPEDQRRKSISTERTFLPLSRFSQMEAKIADLASSLADDVRRAWPAGGRNVTLKLKTVEFELMTRSITLDRFVHSKEDLGKYGLALLREECERLAAQQAKQFKQQAASSSAAAPTQTQPSSTPLLTSPAKLSSPSSAAAAGISRGSPSLSPHSSSSARPSSSSAPGAPHPFDGLLNLRLMGLRLSMLKEDGEAQAAAHGNQSILNFVKPGAAAASQASSASSSSSSASASSTAASSSSSSSFSPSFNAPFASTVKRDPNITSFFSSAPADQAYSQLAWKPVSQRTPAPAPVAPTLDRFLKRLEFDGGRGDNAKVGRSGPISASTLVSSSSPPGSFVAPIPTAVSSSTGSRSLPLVLDMDDEFDGGLEDEEEQSEWFEQFMSQHDADDQMQPMDDTPTFASLLPPQPPPPAATSSVAIAAPAASAATSFSPAALSTAANSLQHAPSVPPAPAADAVAPITCPICARTLGSSKEVDNVQLNRHIDACLAGGGKPAAAEPASSGATRGKRKAMSSAASATSRGMQTLDSILFKRAHVATSTSAPAAAASASSNNATNPIRLD